MRLPTDADLAAYAERALGLIPTSLGETTTQRLSAREPAWDSSLDILPRDLPAKDDVFRDCQLAVAEWMP